MPAWAWGVLTASVLANVVLAVVLSADIREMRVTAAAIGKVEEIATDLKKVAGVEGRLDQLVNNAGTAAANVVDASKRLEAAASSIDASAKEILRRTVPDEVTKKP